MQTLLFLLIIFVVVIAFVLLYLNQKNSRAGKLERGICPSCGVEPTRFFDEKTQTTIEDTPIKSKKLNYHCGCGAEIRFSCKKCGLVEIHTV